MTKGVGRSLQGAGEDICGAWEGCVFAETAWDDMCCGAGMNILMHFYARRGMVEETEGMLRRFEEQEGLRPNIISYNTLLHAYVKKGGNFHRRLGVHDLERTMQVREGGGLAAPLCWRRAERGGPCHCSQRVLVLVIVLLKLIAPSSIIGTSALSWSCAWVMVVAGVRPGDGQRGQAGPGEPALPGRLHLQLHSPMPAVLEAPGTTHLPSPHNTPSRA